MLDDIFATITRLIIAAVAIAVIFFALGFAAGHYFWPVPSSDLAEEYYRGAYDVCVTVLGVPYADACLEGTRKAYERDRHEKPSYQWQWPLKGSQSQDDRQAMR